MKATKQVHLNLDSTSVKQFKIVSINGPNALRKLVCQGMLDTEAAAPQSSV